MSSSVVTFLIVLFCGITFQYVSAYADSTLPYFDTVSLPPTTPSPINISVVGSKHISTVPRITYVTANVTDSMQNTGTQIFVTPASNSGTFTTFGVLGFVKYFLYGIRFIWNSNLGPAASIVNGVGTPLEVISIYQNSNYSSFQEALNHRDGLAIISTRVQVVSGCKNNSDYDTFINYLNQIVPNGATVSVPASAITSWFTVPFRRRYLAYAGSYIDFDTKKQYYCATIIVNTLQKAPKISLAQFQSSFGLFAYDNPLQSQTSTGTPVVTTGPAIVIQDNRPPQ